MLPDNSSFISYKIVSGLQVRMGNNSYIPVLGHGTAIFALNGKRILIRNALHVPGLTVPLYSLRAHMRQLGCGFLGSETTGFLVYFPTFVLSIDTSVDCHLSYEPLGSCTPLGTLHYAQPRCPPTYYPSELASLSSTAIPSLAAPTVIEDDALNYPSELASSSSTPLPSPAVPAIIEDDASIVSMAVPHDLSPPLATKSLVDLGSVSAQLQLLAETINKLSSPSDQSSPAPSSDDPPASASTPPQLLLAMLSDDVARLVHHPGASFPPVQPCDTPNASDTKTHGSAKELHRVMGC